MRIGIGDYAEGERYAAEELSVERGRFDALRKVTQKELYEGGEVFRLVAVAQESRSTYEGEEGRPVRWAAVRMRDGELRKVRFTSPRVLKQLYRMVGDGSRPLDDDEAWCVLVNEYGYLIRPVG